MLLCRQLVEQQISAADCSALGHPVLDAEDELLARDGDIMPLTAYQFSATGCG